MEPLNLSMKTTAVAEENLTDQENFFIIAPSHPSTGPVTLQRGHFPEDLLVAKKSAPPTEEEKTPIDDEENESDQDEGTSDCSTIVALPSPSASVTILNHYTPPANQTRAPMQVIT